MAWAAIIRGVIAAGRALTSVASSGSSAAATTAKAATTTRAAAGVAARATTQAAPKAVQGRFFSQAIPPVARVPSAANVASQVANNPGIPPIRMIPGGAQPASPGALLAKQLGTNTAQQATQAASRASQSGGGDSIYSRLTATANKFNGMFEKLGGGWQRMTSAASSALGAPKPPDTSGTWQDRADRLQREGKLKSEAEVAKQTGSAKPSLQQIVESSEADAYKKYLEEAAQSNKALAEAGKKAVKYLLLLPGGLLAGPAMIGRLSLGVAQGQLEGQRQYSQFSPTIAGTFAKMRLNEFRVGRQMATGTSASTAKLGEALMKAQNDMLPLMIAGVNVMNTLATGLARVASAMAYVSAPLVKIAQKFGFVDSEKKLKQDAEEAAKKTADHIRAAMNPRGPFNKPPGAQ